MIKCGGAGPSHDAAPHLAAPFIADRTKASIAANI